MCPVLNLDVDGIGMPYLMKGLDEIFVHLPPNGLVPIGKQHERWRAVLSNMMGRRCIDDYIAITPHHALSLTIRLGHVIGPVGMRAD